MVTLLRQYLTGKHLYRQRHVWFSSHQLTVTQNPVANVPGGAPCSSMAIQSRYMASR
jgi:hypothetical protein